MPIVVNRWLKVPPPASVPLLNDPPSAVTVWDALPVLVHVTVVPFVTVTVAGVKAKSTTEVATLLPSVVVGVGVGFGVALGVGAGVAVGLGVGFGDALALGVGCDVARGVGVGAVRAVAVGAGVGLGVALPAADPPALA